MHALALIAAENVNDKADLYPHWQELIVGALAFAVLFYFTWKWVLPRVNAMLEERRQHIQGELERAEVSKREADQMLGQYREQLAKAREDANQIIEEARKTADQLRRDLMAKAEEESQQVLVRAQEEIRAERDRVFQELRGQVAEIAVDLAGRVVGQELDRNRHERLIDDYIDQVARSGNGSSN
ncbi:MAG: F0F1 ATP synthase subunit B [Actinomycetota bacterium]